VTSWLSVLIGQNVIPRRYDPMVDGLDPERIRDRLDEIQASVQRSADAMPSHQSFIDQHCAAEL
jgi:tryptophan halogenase